MRHHETDIILVKVVAFGNKRTVIAHVCHRIAEHGAPLLIEVVQTVVNSEMRRRTNRSTGLEVEERKPFAISTEERIHHTDILLCRCFEHHCCGAVAKERTSATVFVVNHRRHLVCTDDDNLLVTATLNHRGSHIKRIQEAATGSPEVKRECVFQSQLANHD